MQRMAGLGPAMPRVCRLGLATRGGSGLHPGDVEWAIERGINYLNWCGHTDGMSRAIASLGEVRSKLVVATQFESRGAHDAEREFASMLHRLKTDYLDIATLYYVESPEEWEEITSPGGAGEFLEQQKRAGRLRMIGLTSHQRRLAASWAGTGLLDMLMVRYNAAHRGAEKDVFPLTSQRGMPVVTFTGLRWGALLRSTAEDPPGFEPPPAVECYRFCLANENVSVALAAPSNRYELEHTLTLLDDWREPGTSQMELMRAHGERVRRHAGVFW